MAGIKFDITGDNRNLLNAANGAQKGVTNAMTAIERAGGKVESTFSKIKTSVLEGFTDITKGMAGITATMAQAFDGSEASLKGFASAAAGAAKKLEEARSKANQVREELANLYRNGAGDRELVNKVEELARAETAARDAAVEATAANGRYWTALNLVGGDLGEVRSRQESLNASYIEMSKRLGKTRDALSEMKQNLKEEEGGLNEVKEAADKTKSSTDDLSDSTKKASGNAKGFADKLGDVSSGAKGLPGPIGDAVSGVNGLTKATLRFIATPIGATLAAISAVLATLTSWFKRTEEGQNALATGSAYFTQVLGSLLDVVDDVGEWLYKAFTKPKDAMADLVEFLKGQVINRIKAVGEMAQGIWKILNGDFSEGFNQIANGYLQGVTGVQNVTGKVSSWIADTNRKAEERVSIAQRQNQLDEAERKNLVERAKLEKEISELREKAYNKSVPEKERAKALQEAQQKIKSLYDEELRLAKERYEIIRDTNQLTHSNKDDKKKEAEAEAELYRIQSQRANAPKGLMREQNRVDSSSASAAKRAASESRKDAAEREKEYELAIKQREQQAKKIQEADNALAAAEIAGIKSAAERERRERAEQHRLALQQIANEEEEMKKRQVEAMKALWEAQKENKGKAWADTAMAKDIAENGYVNIVLPEEDVKLLKARLTQVNAEFAHSEEERIKAEDRANREAINSYLKQYGDYAQKKQAIYDEANEQICELESQLSEATSEEARQAVEARIATVKEGAKEQVDALDKQYGRAKQFMIDLFGDASKKSIGEIDKIIKKYEELVKFLEGGGKGSRDSLKALGFTDAEIDEVLEKLDNGKITVKEFTDSLKGLRGELGQKSPWGKYRNDLEAALKLLKEAEGDNDKIGTAIQNIGIACAEYLPQVERFATSLYNLFGVDDSGARHAISALQGLSVVSQGIGQIVSGDFMDGIVNAVDGVSQAFNGLAEMIDDLSSGRNMEAEYDAIELKAIRKSVDKIVEKIGNDTMAKAMADYEEALKRYSESLEQAQRNLQDAFSESNSNIAGRYNHHSINYYMDDFGGQEEFNQINRLLGTNVQSWGDLWFLSPDQLAEVEAKLPHIFSIIEKGIAKMSSKAEASDDDEIAQAALDAYMELAGKRKEIEEAFSLKMTGTTFDSVKSDFKNMLTDMTSDMEAFGEKVQDILLNSIANQLMSDRYSEELEQWYIMFKNAYTNDGTLDADEIRALSDSYRQTAEEALRERDALMSIFGDAATGAREYFTDIRSSWLSTLTDMNADAKSWEKEITRIMLEDLVQDLILGDEFNTWLADWKRRYADELAHGGDTERLKALIKEMVEMRKQLASDTKDLMDDLGYTELMEEIEEAAAESSDAFSDLHSSFLDALMDMDTDAEEWGRRIGQTLARQIIEQELLGQAFSGFLDDWKADVKYLLSDGFGNDGRNEETLARLKAKIQELVEKYKELAPLAKEFLEALGLIEEAGKEAEKSTESLFGSMASSFTSALMDMEGSVEDFANDMKRTIVQKLVESFLVSERIKPLLDRLGEIINEAMAPGPLSPTSYKSSSDTFAPLLAAVSSDAFQEQLGALGDEMGVLKQVVDALLAGIGYVKEGVDKAAMETEEKVDATLESISSNLKATLMDDTKTAADWVASLTQTIVDELTEAYMATEEFRQGLKKVKDDLKSAIDSGDADRIAAAEEAAESFFNGVVAATERYTSAIKKVGDTTFSGMGDSWTQTLMDMNATAADWGQQIGRTLAQKIISEMIVATKLQPFLDAIQEAYDEAAAAEDATVWSILAAVTPKINEAVHAMEEVQPLIEAILNAVGIYREEVVETFDDIAEEVKYALSDMKSTFVSSLMDMEQSAEDFADSVSKTLAQTFIEKFVLGEAFDQQMEAWQQQFENITNSGLSEDERMRQLKQLRDAIAAAKEGYTEQSQAVMELLGLNHAKDQNATANIADKITYEQADELLGINMAQEMTLEQILATLKGGAVVTAGAGTSLGQDILVQQLLATLQGMQAATSMTGYGSDIFNRLGYTNEYLRAIRDSNDAIFQQFGGLLTRIMTKLERL